MPAQPALSLVFFVSGAAGLIFEIVWFYRCGLVFGNSVWAASLVLSSFMGGLALGNAGVAWLAPRVRRPLRAYAAAEVVVALAGFALAAVLPTLTTIVALLGRPAAGHFWILNLIRAAVAFIILLVPSTAMGVTLPLLVGALAERPGDTSEATHARFGRVLGKLYGWNTLGAVVGVLVAELLLIDRIGVTASAASAALLDLAAAAAVLSMSRGDTKISSVASPRTDRPIARIFACAFLAGCLLLALEMIWFRFLSMFVLTTTLAMSVMLGVVLAAIGLGGLAASQWVTRRADLETAPPTIAFTAGCTVALSYVLFQWLTAGIQIAEWYRVLWLAFVLTFPTAFLSGVLFTFLGAELRHRMAADASTAASLVLANTLGAMCGAPLAAFVLLPSIGMEPSFFVIAAAYAIVGLLALRRLGLMRGPAPAFAAIVLIGALVLFPFGLMRQVYFERVVRPYAADGSHIVATREGPSETILLMRQQWMGKPVYDRLVTNGFSMSGTGVSGLRYMRYFVDWPMLLHAAPLRHVLIVCYGVGVTLGAATDVPSVESIDVVEISRDVVATSGDIYSPATNPLHDQRVRVHLEDGRYFLQTTAERFDLITGEPPPPRTPGAVNICTRDYFRLIYERLAEGGMTTYWLPVARPDPGADVNTIVRAFCDVFEDCSLWNATPFDFMLVGTLHATRQSDAGFTTPFSAPREARHLREAGFERPEQIGATFLGDADYLRALTASTPPLTDDFPRRIVPVRARLSLSDPRYRLDPAVVDMFQRVLDPARARRAFAASDFVTRLWPESTIDATLSFFEHQRIINRILWDGSRPLQQIDDLHWLLTATPLRTLPLWLLGSDEVTQRIAQTAGERSGATEYMRGLGALAARDARGAAAHFSEAERRDFESSALRPLLVYSLCLAGDLDSARQLAHGVTPRDADGQHFWSWMKATFGVGAS